MAHYILEGETGIRNRETWSDRTACLIRTGVVASRATVNYLPPE